MYFNQSVTSIMYHYVRPRKNNKHEGLHYLSLPAFREQLDYLDQHFNIIDPSALNSDDKSVIPQNACLLTFDDGYRDHYDYVFPELVRRNLKGIFFTPYDSLVKNILLDVNKIQLLLSTGVSSKVIIHEFRRHLPSTIFADLYNRLYSPNRYDDVERSFIKKALQYGLEEPFRQKILNNLFKIHVTDDQASLAHEMYLTLPEAQEMLEFGMVFGGHGKRHFWHNKVTKIALEEEVLSSALALDLIGVPQTNRCYSYPFGGFSTEVINCLKRHKFSAAFTVEPKTWQINGDKFMISRHDTNDVFQLKPTTEHNDMHKNV